MVPVHRTLMSDPIESDESREAFRPNPAGSKRVFIQSEDFVCQSMTLSGLCSILSRSLCSKSKFRARRQDTTARLMRLESTFDHVDYDDKASEIGQLEMVCCTAWF